MDVTYSVKDGKNMAKSIFVEKEEEEKAPQGGAGPIADESGEE